MIAIYSELLTQARTLRLEQAIVEQRYATEEIAVRVVNTAISQVNPGFLGMCLEAHNLHAATRPHVEKYDEVLEEKSELLGARQQAIWGGIEPPIRLTE